MAPAVTEIDLGSPRALADLATFVGRAKQANPDGAVRLQLMGPLLVTTVAVLEGTGLLGEGTVLGLRVVRVATVDPEGTVDATVALAAVSDRLARADVTTSTLSVPPAEVRVAWAALAAPREGWEPVGALMCEDVDSIARQGISQVAEGTPDGAGGQAVAALRRRVWSSMSDTVPPIAAGLAFGAHVLGFTAPGEQAAVAAHGRWTRLSTSRGHVLVR
ncbi:hypothetical protein FHX52_1583 [Humibacillus xanthopallidus]|uniref:Uncharacterized protein n=1 Tax=Humibacillus xanthopallidus TaxID=412689 RepID=A0A543PWJ7_9MICO|nr:hypothetical protein FHX52_1583 [Humibacillus xanthopallidus]